MKPFLKYGLIVAATGILISMISYVLGYDKTDAGQYIGYLNVPIMIVAMIYAIKEKREKELGGYIEFGQAFSVSFMMVLIASAITAVYTFFYMKFLNPGMHEYILQKQMEKMESQGQSQEQIDMAMPYVEKFTTPGMISLFAFLGGIVIGAIIALIIAAIMKKPNPNPLDSKAA